MATNEINLPEGFELDSDVEPINVQRNIPADVSDVPAGFRLDRGTVPVELSENIKGLPEGFELDVQLPEKLTPEIKDLAFETYKASLPIPYSGGRQFAQQYQRIDFDLDENLAKEWAQRYKPTRTLTEKIVESFRRGQTRFLLDQSYFDAAMLGEGDKEDIYRQYKAQRAKEMLDPVEGHNLLESMVIGSSNVAATLIEPLRQALPEAAAGAGMAAIAGQLGPQALAPEEAITVPAGIAVGFKVGSAYNMYKQGSGAMLLSMRDMGLEGNTTKVISGIAGIPYALIEQSQMTKLTPGLREGLTSQINKTMTKLAINTMKKYGATLAEETTEEVLQEGVQIAAEDLANYFEKNKIPFNREDLMERANRLKETFKQSLISMALLPAPGAVMDIAYGKKFIDSENPQDVPDIVATNVVQDMIQQSDMPAAQKKAGQMFIGDIQTKIINETIDKFPDPITNQESLERIGNAIKDSLGITQPVTWEWRARKTKRSIAYHQKGKIVFQGGYHRLFDPSIKDEGVDIANKTPGELNQDFIKRVIVHELGHLETVKPPIKGAKTRQVHHTEFTKWVDENTKKLVEIKQKRVPVETSQILQTQPAATAATVETHNAQGGSTINLATGQAVKEGFAVAVSKDFEKVLDRPTITPDDIDAYKKEHADFLSKNPNAVVGTWVDNGKTYIDISIVTPNQEEAMKIGKKNKQLAIFDLGKMESVEVPKEEMAAPREEAKGEKQLRRRQALVLGHRIPQLLNWTDEKRKAFNKGLVGKESMKDMNLEEVRKVANALQDIAKKEGIQYQIEKPPVVQLIEQLETKPTVVPTAKEIMSRSQFRKLVYTVKTWIYNYLENHNKMERFLEYLDGKKGGIFYKTFFEPLFHQDLISNEEVGRKQLDLAVQLGMNKVDIEDWMFEKKEIPGVDIKLTVFDKLGIFALSQNQKSMRYIQNMGFKPTEIVAIKNSLTADEIRILNFIMKEFREQWKPLQAVATLVGFDPSKLQQEFAYVPIMRTDKDLEVQEDMLDQLIDNIFQESVSPAAGMLIKRKPAATGRIETNLALLYFYNAARVGRFINLAPTAKSLSRIINTKAFKQSLSNKTYGKGPAMLKDWLRDAVKGSMSRDLGFIGKQIELLRRKAVLYALGRNILARSRQTLGLFTSMSTYPDMAAYVAKNVVISSKIGGHDQLVDWVQEKSLMMKQREYERDIRLALDKESVAKRLRGRSLSPRAMEGISQTDKYIASVAWKSFYDKGIKDFNGNEDQAIEFADKWVRTTQSMAGTLHLPAFWRGGEIERLLTTFQTELAAIGNYWAHDIIGAKIKGEIGWKLASYRTLVSYIIPAVLFGMINRGRPPEKWKELGFDLATYPLAPFIFFGGLVQRLITGVKSGIVGGAAFESLAALVADARKLPGWSGMDRDEKDKVIRKMIKDVAATTGALTGKITVQDIRTAEGVLDLMSGETNDWRRLVYSKWALEQGQEKSTGNKGKKL